MTAPEILSTKTAVQKWAEQTTDSDTGQSENGEESEDDENFASFLYESCLNLFKELSKESSRLSAFSSTERRHLEESLGRLFLWGDGFGEGRLDRLLGQSIDLRDTILRFIAGIGRILTGKLLTIVCENQQEGRILKQANDLNSLIKKAESIIDEDSLREDIDSEQGSDSDAFDYSESDILEDISCYTLCLMELVPSMERTLTLSDERQTEQLLRKVSFRVSEPAGPYMQNILDKFPRAEITLVERLGRANWQRHMSVRRRMEDISRLAQAIQHYDPVNPEAGDSILRRHPELHDSGLGTTALPQSTDAASATSNTSIGSSSADRRGESRINVSIPYEGAARKPFQCKICGKMLEKVTRSKAWVLHVLADIRPYVCTFSTCKDELVTFPTRKLWANHEFSEHRVEKVWHCMKCADVFVEVNLWRKHLGSRHGIFFSAVKFQSAAALAVKKMPGLLEHTQCPLCLDSVEPTRRAFATHVGKHLETIALTALPPEINYDTESEAGGSEIAIYSAGTEDHAEGITQQSKVAPEPGTINVVGSDQRGAVGSDTEHLTHYSHPEPSEPKCHFSLLHSTDMAGLQPQHEQDLSMLLPPCSKYQDYPQEDDRGKLPQHMSLRSRRIALACQRCRKRKAKCSGFEDSKDGRCTGCRRAQEECTFNAVPSKAQTMVPRHTAYPHVRNTEIATEGYPFNVEIPGNDIFCSVFVWDTRSFSSHYTLLPESIIPKSSADMFLWVERYSRPPDFQVLEIEVGCRAVRQTFLVKRNNTQEYEQFLRLSKTLLENLLGGSTNVRIFVVVFVKPVGATYEGKESDAQKDLESLPSLPPRLAPESETPQTADELATPETEA